MSAREQKIAAPEEDIVIEQRSVIGTVHLSPYGTEDPIILVFRQIAEWLPAHLGREAVNIIWRMWGREFRLDVEELPPMEDEDVRKG